MNKKYRDLDKEEKKAYHKAYYEAHKEEMKKASSENYYANQERNKRNRREYYNKHKDDAKAKSKAYYHAHKEEKIHQRQAYRASHKREMKGHRLKRDYGISLQTYEDMLTSQNGICAICRLKITLVVDHDHKTGKVRALICQSCNFALGYAKDDISILKEMIKYLKKHKQ